MATTQQIDIEAVKHYIDHPADFVEDCIFSGPISTTKHNLAISTSQREILQAIANNRLVSVQSGRGVGKTCTLAWVILYWMSTRPNARVICTGPKFDQLKNTLWAEVNKWLIGSSLTPFLAWTQERLYHKGQPANWFATYVTAKEKENLSGFHEEHMLFLVDEGAGLADEIFYEAILGSLTEEDNRCLVCGNPTRVSGFFYESHNKDKDMWKCLQYSSLDSPFVSKLWLKEMERKWTRNHDVYRVHVLGIPPKGNPDAFIQLEQAEAARAREVTSEGELVLGADCARFGDDLTVVTVRHGYKVYKQEIKEKASHVANAEFIANIARKYRALLKYKGAITINIDDSGSSGGISDILVESEAYKKDEFKVVPVIFSTKQYEYYYDVTSYMWGLLKDEIGNIELPDDTDLIQELAGRTFTTERGRIRIQPKSEFKKEFGHSPDRSDSLILAFAKGIEAKKVISAFNRQSDKHKSVFDVNFDAILTGRNRHYGAVVQQKDLTMCNICAVWDTMKEHLYIYDELVENNPVLSTMIPGLKQTMMSHLYPITKFFADPQLFSQDPVEKTLPKMYTKMGIRCREPFKFDMVGAMALTEQFFKQDKITVHDRCIHTITQLGGWEVTKGKPERKDNGCCLAICLIVSEIDKIASRESKIVQRKSYAPEIPPQKHKRPWVPQRKRIA